MKDIVIKLSGSITIGEGDVFIHEKVHQAIELGYKIIILEMNGVGYMDSSAIGEVASCFMTANKQGIQIALVRLRPKVRKVLQIMAFMDAFQVYDSVEDALQIMRGHLARAAA